MHTPMYRSRVGFPERAIRILTGSSGTSLHGPHDHESHVNYPETVRYSAGGLARQESPAHFIA